MLARLSARVHWFWLASLGVAVLTHGVVAAAAPCIYDDAQLPCRNSGQACELKYGVCLGQTAGPVTRYYDAVEDGGTFANAFRAASIWCDPTYDCTEVMNELGQVIGCTTGALVLPGYSQQQWRGFNAYCD